MGLITVMMIMMVVADGNVTRSQQVDLQRQEQEGLAEFSDRDPSIGAASGARELEVSSGGWWVMSKRRQSSVK